MKPLLKQSKPIVGNFGGELRSEWQLTLKLHASQVISSNVNLHSTGSEFMDTKSMAYILGQFKHDLKNLLFVHQVGGTGDAVTNRLDGADKVFMAHSGTIRSVGKGPQFEAVDAKPVPQSVWACGRQLADGMDTITG